MSAPSGALRYAHHAPRLRATPASQALARRMAPDRLRDLPRGQTDYRLVLIGPQRDEPRSGWRNASQSKGVTESGVPVLFRLPLAGARQKAGLALQREVELRAVADL